MTRNGGVRPAEKAAQEQKEKEAAMAEKVELEDDDEEYYPSGAKPAEKGELLLSKTLALRCPKGFAFIKSSEFEQFKENWEANKGKKRPPPSIHSQQVGGTLVCWLDASFPQSPLRT